MQRDHLFIGLFGVLVVNERLASAYLDTWPEWYLMSKPALLLSIILYFVAATRSVKHPMRFLLLAGFVASWLGDISLMFQKEDEVYFLMGLISFFLAHVFYILSFRYWFYDNHHIPLIKKQPWMMFLLVAYALGLFRLLEPGLGSMKIAVIAYMVIILLMVVMALNRFAKVSRKGFALVFAGALLFLVSDSFLAYNKFAEPVPMAGAWIMLTYSAAQLLIMLGGLHELRVHARWQST